MADSTTQIERFLVDLADLIYEHFGEDGAGEDQDANEDELEDDEKDEDVDEDEEDEADEEDEEDEEDEGYTREELEDMSTRKLRSVARDQGFSTSDLRGQDEDAIIAMILGEDEDEDEDEDE